MASCWNLPDMRRLWCIKTLQEKIEWLLQSGQAVKKDGKVYVQAGGGIVADSVPEMEYEESANKAMAVIQAVEQAQEVEESCFF